jgi:plastocyanin
VRPGAILVALAAGLGGLAVGVAPAAVAPTPSPDSSASRPERVEPGPARRAEILMKAVAFAPESISMRVGDTVTWRNVDIVRHNVVHPGRFESPDLPSGGTFTWVPLDTGLVRYRCTIHPRMRGEVVVVP